MWIDFKFTDASKIDGSNTRAKMIMCSNFLTEDQFKSLGMSKAQELMNGKLWVNEKRKMQNLVKKAITDNWTVKQCREAVAALAPKPKAANDSNNGEAGSSNSQPKSSVSELEQVKAELERLKALLLAGDYATAAAIASGEMDYQEATPEAA